MSDIELMQKHDKDQCPMTLKLNDMYKKYTMKVVGAMAREYANSHGEHNNLLRQMNSTPFVCCRGCGERQAVFEAYVFQHHAEIEALCKYRRDQEGQADGNVIVMPKQG